jgi:splicing factor 3B subunit 4
MSAAIEQRNQEATVYVGNLDEKMDDEVLWELMLQAGPVVNVHMPKDKVTGIHQNYGFVEFRSEEDADYAMKIMNMVKVFGKPIKVNKASQDKLQTDVGANIFIGNLDPDVDEKLLYDTFSAFGGINLTPKIMRDQDTGVSKGYGFVCFDSFEASDMAIDCMNGQYLCNRSIIVQYAFKKETQGERHGSQAERMIASSNQVSKIKPHTMFSGGVGEVASSGASTMPPTMYPPQGYGQQSIVPPPPPMMMDQSMMMQQHGGMPPPPPLPPNGFDIQPPPQQPQSFSVPPPPPAFFSGVAPPTTDGGMIPPPPPPPPFM